MHRGAYPGRHEVRNSREMQPSARAGDHLSNCAEAERQSPRSPSRLNRIRGAAKILELGVGETAVHAKMRLKRPARAKREAGTDRC